MVERIFLLSYSKYLDKNLNFIVKTFLETDYLLKFIFDIINTRFKALLKKQILKQCNNNENENNKKEIS